MATELPESNGLEATQPFTNEKIAGAATAADGGPAPQAIEPIGDGTVAAASPVTTPGRRGGARWGIALGAVAIAIGGLAAAAFLLTAAAPASKLVGWAPVDSAVYAEVRLDLPGDQRAQLGEFLGHFPGFSDQAILDTKIDEALDRIVGGATDGRQDFSTKIKPWFDGQIAVAAAASTGGSAGSETGHGLAMVAVTDVAAARAWFEAAATDSQMTLATESYGGTELLVDPDGNGAAAFLDGVMLMGDPASVRAAVDSAGSSELAKAPNFVAARGAFQGDQLAFAYVDLVAAMGLAGAGPGDLNGAVEVGNAFRDVLPAWMAITVRTDGSGLTAEAAWPHIEGAGVAATNRAGKLASVVPASTIVLTDAHDVGKVLQALVETARNDPASADSLAQLEQAAALLGGVDALVGWVGDLGVAVTSDGTTVDGGLVIIPTDRAAADRLATTLTGFLDLFGAQSGIAVRTEDHAGTSITIVDLGNAQDLLGGALGAGGLEGLPIDALKPSGRVELAWAIRDDVAVIALGPAFVRSILDVDAASSLGSSERYRALLAAVGTENAGSTFVDLRALRTLAEGFMATAGGSTAADYDRDVKPYLEPFDAWIQANTVGENLDRAIIRIAVD